MTQQTKDWTKSSWLNFQALQQPNWPDRDEHRAVLASIAKLPPLVFAGEIRNLKAKLARAVTGDAFLLQGGDCAEDFQHCTAPSIRESPGAVPS